MTSTAFDRPFVREHRKWFEDFVFELRMADVPGKRIGEAIADVESFCAESGRSPADAFGEPTAYAASLDPVPDDGLSLPRLVIPVILQVMGLIAFSKAFDAWVAGTAVTWNAGELACLAGVTGLLVLLATTASWWLRRPWILPLFGVGVVGLGVLGSVAARQDWPVLLVLPAGPTAAVFATAVCVLAVEVYRRSAGDADVIVLPGDGAPVRRRQRRRNGLVAAGNALLVPLGLVFNAVVTLALR